MPNLKQIYVNTIVVNDFGGERATVEEVAEGEKVTNPMTT